MVLGFLAVRRAHIREARGFENVGIVIVILVVVYTPRSVVVTMTPTGMAIPFENI